MLHNTRREPHSKLKSKRLPWRYSMTLCIAALCGDAEGAQPANRIVFGSDYRAETSWAAGNVAFKFGWIGEMGVLMAGEMSKALDFIATARSVIDRDDAEPLRLDNLVDKFNEVSSTHKEKLCRRYVHQRLGIDFERFLAHGEAELPTDVRARIFNDLSQLDYGCELIVFGFVRHESRMLKRVLCVPRIIEIDRYGEVFQHQNFAAIGTGSIIAKSTLYQREQMSFLALDQTLYHVYEAAKLAHSTAPGVGEIEFLVVAYADDEGAMRLAQTTPTCLETMSRLFAEVGPKSITSIPALGDNSLIEIDTEPSDESSELGTDTPATPPT